MKTTVGDKVGKGKEKKCYETNYAQETGGFRIFSRR